MTEHELSERIARLEERMKTNQAEYKTDIARLAEDIAKRDKANIQWMIGMAVAGVLLIIGVLGFLIRFPTPH